MFLPRVASNKETRYESWAIGIVNDVKYAIFQVLTFEPSVFSNQLASRYCGNLMKFDLEVPFEVNASVAERTYYLDIDFSTNHAADLGSNLTIGENYPVYHSDFDTNATFTLMSRKIRIMNQSSYNYDSNTAVPYNLWLASKHSAGDSITATLYYTENNKNPSDLYVILYKEFADVAIGGSVAADTINLTGDLD
eukprot:CAMPEP_0168316498 /NCGR_PEP_ID=MMETSP0210-20121227/15967_1 /TAXON_ID=40633 /ORGANISM="Condylostoma magnum, Strain COL2" /LENGTH=193 /DNA_ID=CAMNT_0008298047 /DNA_START=1835 /DNA_END=2416 /DNA_ORIENTATION=-